MKPLQMGKILEAAAAKQKIQTLGNHRKRTPTKCKTGGKKAELQIEHFMTSQQSCLVSKALTPFIRRLLLLLLPLVARELKAIHLAQFLSGSVPEGVARSPGNSIC